jgi:type IV pilus assembly protein PilW
MGAKAKRYYRGFGLVEVMIALALGTVIILGISTIFTDSSKTLLDISKSGRQLENALFSLDLLGAELAHAGFWGEARTPIDPDLDIFRGGETPNSPPSPAFPLPPAICLGTGASGYTSKVELAYGMAYPLWGGTGVVLNAEFAANACKGSGGTPRAASQFVVVRRASTCLTGEAACPQFNQHFHLQVNGCFDQNNGLTGGEVRLSSDVTELDYETRLCDSSVLAPLRRYNAHIYYVNQQDQLVRMRFGWNADLSAYGYEPDIMADGVEYLIFQWGIDNNLDGQIDLWIDEPIGNQWLNIVAAKVWLVVRGLSPEPGYEDSATYQVADQTYVVPSANKAFRRAVHSRVVELTNLAGVRR